MNTDFRASLIKKAPAVFLSLLIGLTGVLGFVVWRFYSQTPEETRVTQQRTLTAHDELYAIDFPREGQGWAVGKFGIILYTANGGISWSQQSSGTTKSLTSVSFADERHGFAVGSGGTILTTVDGGRSWQRRDSGTKEHLLEVRALSVRSAFAVGGFGAMLSTIDGGATWTKQKLSWPTLIPDVIRATGDVEPNLNTVHFVNEKVGWSGGEFGLILYTRDGGQSWVTQRAGSSYPQIASIRFRDALNGWAVGQKGSLLKTSDGGKTWRQISLEEQQDLYAISLAEKRAVIVGRGVILNTINEGSDWARLGSPGQNIWFSAVAIDREKALAVGQAGAIHTISLSESQGIVN